MAQFHPAWVEHQRKRWQRTNAHLYIRHDAYRFMPPGSPRYVGKDVVRYFWPEQGRDQTPQSNSLFDPDELDAERAELLQLKSELAEINTELKLRRLLRTVKAYNPDQPRVPAGSREGGQWAGDGSSIQSGRIRLAGPLPNNDTPEIPQQRPPTARERNQVARAVARWVSRYGGPVGRVLGYAYWLYDEYPYIKAAQDPPKSLEELQRAVSTPEKGYDIHHIVEQTSAMQDGYPRNMIEAAENKVRIPTYTHWDINAWYQTKSDAFGGLSPRDYLRGKSWDERRRIGLDALTERGVLKP
jgi:hypothetical protein